MADPDVYPMPLFVQLQVADVVRSTDWYGALGFEVVYEAPAMAHVRYRRYADVMLVEEGAGVGPEAAPDGPRGTGVAVYLTVEDEPVEAVAERARDAGTDHLDGPVETAWNTREVRVRDPDGYRLVFSAVLDPDRSFEDVIGTD